MLGSGVYKVVPNLHCGFVEGCCASIHSESLRRGAATMNMGFGFEIRKIVPCAFPGCFDKVHAIWGGAGVWLVVPEMPRICELRILCVTGEPSPPEPRLSLGRVSSV